MHPEIEAVAGEVEEASRFVERLFEETGKVIVGQRHMVERGEASKERGSSARSGSGVRLFLPRKVLIDVVLTSRDLTRPTSRMVIQRPSRPAAGRPGGEDSPSCGPRAALPRWSHRRPRAGTPETANFAPRESGAARALTPLGQRQEQP